MSPNLVPSILPPLATPPCSPPPPHLGRLYRLDTHLDRLLASACGARIDVTAWPRARLADAVVRTVATSGLRAGGVRYWLSAGPGDFKLTTEGCLGTAFYCVVFEEDTAPAAKREDGAGAPSPAPVPTIAEVTVRDVPLKPATLGLIKTNNYLLNALTAIRARELGGTNGILIDEAGDIAEVVSVLAILGGRAWWGRRARSRSR